MIFAVEVRKRSLKKIQASAGFEPVTSAIPVQCSTNRANEAITVGSRSILVNFFQASLSQLLKLRINREDLS